MQKFDVLTGVAAPLNIVNIDTDMIIPKQFLKTIKRTGLGKSLKGSIDIGFSRAFSTILDGHMTTAAAGWVLLQYGTGPIHGFAVLLLVGIGTTLFVNTWVTRLLFDWYVHKKKDHGTAYQTYFLLFHFLCRSRCNRRREKSLFCECF